MKTKICSKCGEEKLLSEFTKDKSRKDGLYLYCKECYKNEQKEYCIKFPWKQTLYKIKECCNNPNHPRYKDYGLRIRLI